MFKNHANKIIILKRKKNQVINKWAAGIMWKSEGSHAKEKKVR